jgi:PAS domain S-box-containing protein
VEKAASNQKVAVSLNLEKGTDMLRKSGIEVVGDVPWGTHFCQFYETKEDLIDVLVPYFKAGLENNEFCMWITSKPLTEEEAKKAMRKAVLNFDLYLKRGQMEIVPYSDWYLKDGAFNLQRVLGAWVDKLDQALAERYDGIRVTGNTAWLERQDWKSFTCYEEGVNSVIGKHRMIAICTYSLDKCGASEVIDVVRNHQFALIKRMGEWELIESSELKRTKEDLEKSEMMLKKTFATSPDAITVSDLNGNIVECNEQTLNMHGYSSKEELIGKSALELIAKKDHKNAMENLKKTLEQGSVRNIEYAFLTKDGREFPAELSASLIKDFSGKPTGFVAITKDVTERKKAEDALRKSEIKHRTLFENLPQKIFFKDKNSVYISCNENYSGDLKIKSNEITGKTDYDFYPKELAEKYRVDDQRIMKSGKTEDIEEEYIQDGHKIFVHTVKTPVKDENGNVVGILGIFWDISERKKAEEELIRLSNAVKMSADSIVIGDLDAKIIDVNEVTLKMYGTDNKRDIIGKSSFDLIAPEDREKALAGMKEVLEKEYSKDREYNIIAKDGSRIPVEMNTAIMKDADGKPIGFVAISRDITERKEMEEKLRQYSEHLEELVQKRTEELLESEKRYSVLVEEARDIVAIIQDEKIVFVNRKGSEVMGYSQEELIGLPYENIVTEKYRQLVNESYKRRMLGEMAPSTYEVELISKTGEHVPTELGVTRIDHQGRPASLIFGRDIRERKQLEGQHLKLEKLATMGELATMVAHDLRNPLTSIRNASFYIKNTCPNRATAECKTALEMFDIIEQETVFANNIINDLLDFAAKRPLQKKRQNINEIIEDSLTKGNIPRNTEVERNFKKAIIGIDEKQLERVFLNLIKNAVQAMPDGGKLAVTTKETKDNVEIIFADTGVGISEENMSKLFTPLFTTKAKGIGMGLAICKNIVEQHNGTIEVKSKVGQGTTFTIKLPKKEEANNQ